MRELTVPEFPVWTGLKKVGLVFGYGFGSGFCSGRFHLTRVATPGAPSVFPAGPQVCTAVRVASSLFLFRPASGLPFQPVSGKDIKPEPVIFVFNVLCVVACRSLVAIFTIAAAIFNVAIAIFTVATVPASQTASVDVLLDAEPSSRETLMPAWVSVLQYVYQHEKWVAGSTCRPRLISARATGDARAGSVFAQAAADLGRAATAPVGLPRCCRCTDPSTWVGWARGTPRLGSAAPFTGTPRPTGTRKSKMGPKRLFRGFWCRIRPCGGDQGRSGHLLGSLRCAGSLGMSFENPPKFRFFDPYEARGRTAPAECATSGPMWPGGPF